MTTRRKFLINAAAGAAIMPLASRVMAQSSSEPTIKWRMQTYAGPALAVDIEVGYPYSHLFDVTFEKVMKDFKKAHPDINVTFRATYENYEDGTNTVLRESVANSLPDISMQGLNRQRLMVEKGIAHSLEP